MTGLRLLAVGVALYAFATGCGKECTEAFPGSKQDGVVCRLPGEPEIGKKSPVNVAGSGGSVTQQPYDAGVRGGSGGSGGGGTVSLDAGRELEDAGGEAGPAETCGNGLSDIGEQCDTLTCPIDCDTGNKCLIGRLEGSRDECTAICRQERVTACKDDDGCCAEGCNFDNDSDCSASCGNGITEDQETCDGNCPESCDDGNACTVDMQTGSVGQCSLTCTHMPAVASRAKDGCCPEGANVSTDADCLARCGDGVVSSAETCDPMSNRKCPANCDDNNPCTDDETTGSADECTISCKHTASAAGTSCGSGNRCAANGQCVAPMCGDGIVDRGEICDGNCPSSCPMSGEQCRENTLTGSACGRQCEMVLRDMGTVCGTGNHEHRGACTTTGDCMHNNWYRPCTADAACFSSLLCLHYQCKMECETDAQCGAPAVGPRGRCVDGYCERRCTQDNECTGGQTCVILPGNLGGACRPKPCSITADCPDDMLCTRVRPDNSLSVCLPR